MKIFVTGAAGYIGGSIAEHLRGDGHTVRGLVRRDTQAEDLAARGITPVLGTKGAALDLNSRGGGPKDGNLEMASSEEPLSPAVSEHVW